MIKQSKTHFEASFPGDLDESYSESMKFCDEDASISTAESVSAVLPKTQQFYKFSNGIWSIASITLIQNHIILKEEFDNYSPLNDVIGATVKRVNIKFLSGPVDSQFFYRIRLHFLVKEPKHLSKSHSFCRNYYRAEYYSEDEKTALKWKNLILHAANNSNFTSLWKTYGFEDLPIFKRLLLVFINPKSGHNTGEMVWSRAKKLLKRAGCEFIEVFTQYSGHSKEYVKNLDPKQLIKIDGIMTISGDGCLHEVVNGFFQRLDWQKFSHIPFGIVPCGTSNGLIKNLLFKTNECISLETACYLIAKGKTIKSDLTMLEQEDGSKIFSFLLLAWATMAQIDINSDKLRPLGKFRFTVCGLYNIAKLKRYHAKISYTTEAKDLPKINEDIKGEGWQEIINEFSHFSLHNMAWIGSKYQAVPPADFQDGVNHLLTLKEGETSRVKLGNALSKMNGRLFQGDKPKPKFGLMYEKVKAFRIEPSGKNLGYYAIDGEAYKATKIQGRVLEKTLTLFGN